MKKAALYHCQVMHRRHFPVDYRFNYQVFSLLVDIDHVDSLRGPLFAVDGFNLFSLRQRDHAARDGSVWRPWVVKVLQDYDLRESAARVQLLCFPRVLGYGFNPLSLWYCYRADDRLGAVICEVRNTFGEHHHYVLPVTRSADKPLATGSKQKIFHVSPFIDMQARYEFFIHPPSERLNIVIHEYEDDQLMLIASQQGDELVFNSRNLLRCFVRIPFLSLKVMGLIHWQALKIWLKGGRFYSKPPPPKEDIS